MHHHHDRIAREVSLYLKRIMKNESVVLIILLALIGIVLTATTIKGTFIIDDINYMVSVIGLSEGKLTVPNTENLAPSRELFYFDPDANKRIADRSSVVSLVPPLYAPIALPFLLFGWRGLVFINTLSFLLTAAVIFIFAKRLSKERSTPWLALATVLCGGYAIEYAQGVWPHMLSMFLCVAGVYVAYKARQEAKPIVAIGAGLLLGIASGIREQNIFLTACVGLTLLLWGKERLRSAVLYGLGVLIPLTMSATLNYYRLGLWHPFPKVGAYAQQATDQFHRSSLLEPFKVFWAKVIDFSTHELIPDPIVSIVYKKNMISGAILVTGVVKKALLQSCPWIGLVLIVMILIWMGKKGVWSNLQTELRALSLLIIPTLLMFTLAGYGRMDGLAYNQRYFHELIPLAALVLALSVDGLYLSKIKMLIGFLSAGLLFAIVLMLPSKQMHDIAIIKIPLFLALLLVITWILKNKSVIRPVIAISLGLCIGWSFFVHTCDDLVASRRRKAANAVLLTALESTIPDHSALFTYWGAKDAAGPIQLEKKVTILDTWADEGADVPRLKIELRRQNWRIFILNEGFPPPILRSLVGNDSLAVKFVNPKEIDEVIERNNSPVSHVEKAAF